MKRFFKWSACAIGAVFTLALVALLAIYLRSEGLRNQHWEVPAEALVLEDDAVATADIDEGKRLATVFGCFNGCHGGETDGGVFIDIPNVIRLIAPSLSHLASQTEDAELLRSIRFGVKRDGTSVWGMPSDALYHLSDRQLASIIAFLRNQPASAPVEEQHTFRILARVGMALGDFKPPPSTTTTLPPRLDPEDPAGEHALGRQLAVTACSECHGSDLQGNPQFPSPALGIVRGYSQDAFEKLLRTGIAIGEREVGLMSTVAKRRFSSLTERESAALYNYLAQTGGMDRVAAVSAPD